MAILDDSYDNLKLIVIEKLSSGNCNTDVNNLKELFASEINSQRCLSRISDIASLIAVLEKRDVLSPMNIGAFDLIFNALEISHALLDAHSELLKSNTDCLYSRKYEDEIADEPSHGLPGYRHVLNNLGSNNHRPNIETSSINGTILSNRVLNTVCSQIGQSWKSLARYLKVVPESTIDKIERDRRTKSDDIRARMVLDEFQEKEEPSELRPRLLKALRLAGRMDIHDQVEKIILREL